MTIAFPAEGDKLPIGFVGVQTIRTLFVGAVLLVSATLLVPAAAGDLGGLDPPIPEEERSITVVAVIDDGFNPYHYDFVGHQHPWNRDGDATNDIDFTADPATYIKGFPGAMPLPLTIPTAPDQNVDSLKLEDSSTWDRFQKSTPDEIRLHWFPGTKIVGAAAVPEDICCLPSFWGGNESHGTQSAAVAAGNRHGTCPECVFVLLRGRERALEWALKQPWIDVVTNSWGDAFMASGLIDDASRPPIEATRAAVDAGQTVVFAAGNGPIQSGPLLPLTNTNAPETPVPDLTHFAGTAGPDWIVTVGSISWNTDQTLTAAGKPVDISSYGDRYPSTGGTRADGTGTHRGTSNATPVVAGTIARVIQKARELLHDTSEGHRDGVVASSPGRRRFTCGTANPSCPLGDGVLDRAEAEGIVFQNVQPSKNATVQPPNRLPPTEYSYFYQGHGVVYGRGTVNLNGVRFNADKYEIEQKRFLDVLRGDAKNLPRPTGETNWMTVDSKCRQRLWGTWNSGYYRGGKEPTLSPIVDPIATSFNAWCSAMPQGAWDDAYYG